MAPVANRQVQVGTPPDGESAPHPEAAGAPVVATVHLDEALAALQEHRDAWVATGIDERIALLAEIRQRMAAVGDRWVAAILDAKGTTQGDAFGVGEEWANYALTLRWMRLLHRSLRDIRSVGLPRLPAPLATRHSGQVVARVFPQTFAERIQFMGVTGEIWMQPGVTRDDVRARQALAYQNRNHPGQVTLILGAGNAAFLSPEDVLYQLFIADRVVILKPNPINAYLGPLLGEAMHPLVQRGFLRIVHGGAVEGAYLSAHPAVDAIHLTGCDKTFEAIVFGSGPEGQRRKAEHRPLLNKPISAELGNVTPIIVVPGPWKGRDIREQALHLATWLVLNAGCNCISERVIVQHQDWPQREALLAALGEALARVPTHRAYYPGAAERHAAFVAAHPSARSFGDPPPGHLPWTLIPGVDPANPRDICFTTEAFCSLVAEAALPAADPADFLDQAVVFANDTLWGTLGATIMVHPRSLADPQVAAALERALTNLHYGTISINHWLGYAYYFGLSPWGGYPGSDVYDVQSGIGMANNALMLDDTQKTIYRAPFHKLIDPYTIRSKRVAEFGQKLAAYEGTGSPAAFAGLLWTALRC